MEQIKLSHACCGTEFGIYKTVDLIFHYLHGGELLMRGGNVAFV